MFQSTRPARGATRWHRRRMLDESVFQSTRPARGATLSRSTVTVLCVVSIHAPRAGRDASSERTSHCDHGVSIHAPRAGRDCFTLSHSPPMPEPQDSANPTRSSAPRARNPNRPADPNPCPPHVQSRLREPPGKSMVRFTSAHSNQSTDPEDRRWPSLPRAPPAASSCLPENRTASCPATG